MAPKSSGAETSRRALDPRVRCKAQRQTRRRQARRRASNRRFTYRLTVMTRTRASWTRRLRTAGTSWLGCTRLLRYLRCRQRLRRRHQQSRRITRMASRSRRPGRMAHLRRTCLPYRSPLRSARGSGGLACKSRSDIACERGSTSRSRASPRMAHASTFGRRSVPKGGRPIRLRIVNSSISVVANHVADAIAVLSLVPYSRRSWSVRLCCLCGHSRSSERASHLPGLTDFQVSGNRSDPRARNISHGPHGRLVLH